MNRKYIYCDLSSQVIEIKEIKEENLINDKGLGLAFSLYEEYKTLFPIVITKSNIDTKISGANIFNIAFFSPVSKAVRYLFSNTSFGRSLALNGYEAIVLTGHSRRLTYLEINGPDCELMQCEQMRDSSALKFSKVVSVNQVNDVIAIGRAGEKRALISSVFFNGELDIGANGIGAVFGEANLKAVVVKNEDVDVSAYSSSLDMDKKIKSSIKLRHLKLYGNSYMLEYGNRFGFLPLYYYSNRTDPRIIYLSGKIPHANRLREAKTCSTCRVSCYSRTEDGVLLPRFEDIMALGLNLGFFNIENIHRLVTAVREEGLNAVETGAVLSYIKTLDKVDYTIPCLKGAKVEEFERIIHLIGERRGVGDKLSSSLEVFPQAIKLSDNSAVLCDLRGAELQAGFLALKERPLCFPDLLYGLSHKVKNPKSRGALLLYSQLIAHLSFNSSIPPEILSALMFKNFFKRQLIKYRFFTRYYINRIGKELLGMLMKEIEKYEELSGPVLQCPEYFMNNPKSNKDANTLSFNSMMFYYNSERVRLSKILSESVKSSALS